VGERITKKHVGRRVRIVWKDDGQTFVVARITRVLERRFEMVPDGSSLPCIYPVVCWHVGEVLD
jgi:hypothetical protein